MNLTESGGAGKIARWHVRGRKHDAAGRDFDKAWPAIKRSREIVTLAEEWGA